MPDGDLRRHPLVGRLTTHGGPGIPAGVPDATVLDEYVTFVGFVNGALTRPGADSRWLLLYREWQLINWLLVEGVGIANLDTIPDDEAPDRQRDVVWVTPDTAVGCGRGPQSEEALFLTGDFTRAGDFGASDRGGRSAPETGIFCPTTPLCGCGKRSNY